MPVARAVNKVTAPDGTVVPVDIYYNVEGPDNGEVVLWIAGLSGQLTTISYNTYVAPLVEQGYRVIRFDNRDCGFSSQLTPLGHQSILVDKLRNRVAGQNQDNCIYPDQPFAPQAELLPHDLRPITDSDYEITAGAHPRDFMDKVHATPYKAPYPNPYKGGFWENIGFGKKQPEYELFDMAVDAILLLRYLNITKAHVIGISMGGMIAQCIAALQPSLVLSLTLIMTTTGNIQFNAELLFLLKAFILRVPPSRHGTLEEWIDFSLQTQNMLGCISNDSEKLFNNGLTPHDFIKSLLLRAGRQETGILRQMDAIDNQESRDSILDFLAPRIPIMIFHGNSDQLVPTANANHMYSIAKSSIQRTLYKNPVPSNPAVSTPSPLSTTSLYQEIHQCWQNKVDIDTFISSQKFNNHPVYIKKCLLADAAHEVTDYYATYCIPLLLAHFDYATNRANVGEFYSYKIPVLDTKPLSFGCEVPDASQYSDPEFAKKYMLHNIFIEAQKQKQQEEEKEQQQQQQQKQEVAQSVEGSSVSLPVKGDNQVQNSSNNNDEYIADIITSETISGVM